MRKAPLTALFFPELLWRSGLYRRPFHFATTPDQSGNHHTATECPQINLLQSIGGRGVAKSAVGQ